MKKREGMEELKTSIPSRFFSLKKNVFFQSAGGHPVRIIIIKIHKNFNTFLFKILLNYRKRYSMMKT